MYVTTEIAQIRAIHDNIKLERQLNEEAAQRRGITVNQFYSEREHYMERVNILKRVWIRSWNERPDLSEQILQRMKSTKEYYIGKLKGQ